ncbi:hypothetical protein [uncultured Brevibacillus sp.]|uniref:hypothetical protein n=1 Tax=uncultured Brevibacillus sp. TaxID=169970 RepID=UPI00259AAD9A|nr:hypothetical protein [uncultured Brevibacillus sp.]
MKNELFRVVLLKVDESGNTTQLTSRHIVTSVNLTAEKEKVVKAVHSVAHAMMTGLTKEITEEFIEKALFEEGDVKEE